MSPTAAIRVGLWYVWLSNAGGVEERLRDFGYLE